MQLPVTPSRIKYKLQPLNVKAPQQQQNSDSHQALINPMTWYNNTRYNNRALWSPLERTVVTGSQLGITITPIRRYNKVRLYWVEYEFVHSFITCPQPKCHHNQNVAPSIYHHHPTSFQDSSTKGRLDEINLKKSILLCLPQMHMQYETFLPSFELIVAVFLLLSFLGFFLFNHFFYDLYDTHFDL